MIREKVTRLIALTALGLLLAVPGGVVAQTSSPATPKQSAPKATMKKAASPAKPATPVKLELEPRALDIMKAAGSRLAAAHTISFTAVETFESLSRQGVPLVYANRYEVTLQRPDKLRVILTGDGPASEFYYDGKTMMAFAPVENLVAIADAPTTIDAMLETVYHQAAIYFPFDDLIVTDPYGDLAPGLQHAYYIGQSKLIGGTTTDMVAYAGDGVFVQMAVGAEDKLPRVLHAIFLDDPDKLRHNLILSDWQLDGTVPPEAFTSTKAASAKRMEFAHPHPESPAGTTAPAKNQPPTKTKPATSPSQPN